MIAGSLRASRTTYCVPPRSRFASTWQVHLWLIVRDRVRPPFNVGTLGQVGAEASLTDAAHIQKAVKLVLAERKKVLPALSRLGLATIPSAGNFVLIDVSPRRGADMFELLLSRGIIVRSMDEYGFPNHIRDTYGLPAENRLFLAALKEMLR